MVEELGDRSSVTRSPAAAAKRVVERRVRRVHPRLVAGAHVVIHLRHQPLELGEIARAPSVGTVMRMATASSAIRIAYSPRVRIEKLGDPHAAVRLGEHQALALEHPQRLAQRRAADVELLRQGDLRGRFAGPDLPAQDRVAQSVVDDRDVLPVSGTGGAHSVHRLPRLRLMSYLDTVGSLVA